MEEEVEEVEEVEVEEEENSAAIVRAQVANSCSAWVAFA